MNKKERLVYQKEYRENHKEDISAYKKEYQKNHKEEISAHKKEYYQNHKEEILVKNKEYYQNHKEEKKEYDKEYQKNHKEKISAKDKEYYQNHKEEVSAYQKERLKSDIQYKLASNLRSRLNITIRKNYKAGSAVRDLGCSIEELKNYLEKQFLSGMTWNNWGNKKGCWSIDHIIPLSSVDLTDRKQFLKVCHYTNLRPIWHIDNIRKGKKINI